MMSDKALRTCCGHTPAYLRAPYLDELLWVLKCNECGVQTEEYGTKDEVEVVWNRGNLSLLFNPSNSKTLCNDEKTDNSLLAIGGGQAGSDIGGTIGAQRAGIKTGGFTPKGWRTEKGPQPILAQYGLIEHASSDYAARTEANVMLADITIIFSSIRTSPGTVKTQQLAKRHKKPYLCIDPFQCDAQQLTLDFLIQHQPKIINFAGNRESKCLGISKQVAYIVEKVLLKYRCADTPVAQGQPPRI